MLFIAVSLLSSCSETDDENTEFADWQNRNEAYFMDKYADILAKKAAGVTNVDTVRCYSKYPEQKSRLTLSPWKSSQTALEQEVLSRQTL